MIIWERERQKTKKVGGKRERERDLKDLKSCGSISKVICTMSCIHYVKNGMLFESRKVVE